MKGLCNRGKSKLKNMKKRVRKRIRIWNEDVWDCPSGGTRKGEREYRKEVSENE